MSKKANKRMRMKGSARTVKMRLITLCRKNKTSLHTITWTRAATSHFRQKTTTKKTKNA